MYLCMIIVAEIGPGCFIAKADIQSAFHLIPIHPDDHYLLGFSWEDQVYYYKVAAMGCSSSCLTFEVFSTAVQWILKNHFCVKFISHILDDFMFFAPTKEQCLQYLNAFQSLASDINLPLNHDKTVAPTQCAVLHGIEVDTIKMEARLPQQKIEKAYHLLKSLSCKRTATLQQLQELIGFLNFACKVIPAGRAFLRRLVNLTVGISAPHHHRNINKDARKDLAAWLLFLDKYNGISVFSDSHWSSSDIIRLYTDSSDQGFAAVFGKQWFQGAWPEDWTVTKGNKNIALLELVPIVLAMDIWGDKLTGKKIIFMCDNQALTYIINKSSSRHPEIMALVRRLVVTCMLKNIYIYSEHIPGYQNVVADRFSRFQNAQAMQFAPFLLKEPVPLPEALLPWNRQHKA